MSAIMDDLLGAERGRTLSASGPASVALAAAVSPAEDADSLLAGAFWWAAERSPEFANALSDIGVDPNEARSILVAHAGRTRYDLLVLSADYDGEPTRLPIRLGAREMVSTWSRMVRRGPTIVDRIRELYPRVNDRTVQAAIGEVALVAEFGVVVAPLEPEDDTAVPVPAIMVRRGGERELCATVGAVFQRGGTVQVTTALHAVADSLQRVLVGDRYDGTVIVSDKLTDSCLISLRGGTGFAAWAGHGGARRTILPSLGEPAMFHRVDVGVINATIMGADMSALEPQRDFASKVYTEPMTRRGDSGTALLDSSDRIVGFAARRSRMGSAVPYSLWIWAEQVLAGLGVL